VVSGGGGIYVTGPGGQASVQILNVLIAGNEVRSGTTTAPPSSSVVGGGGLLLQGVTANFAHATIANNRLGEGLVLGMGILLFNRYQPATTANIASSVIANHRSSDPTATAVEALRFDPAGRNVVNYTAVSMYANNSRDDNSSLEDPAQRGQFDGLNNVLRVADAGFVAAGSDYHLRADSPARDAATGSDLNVDLDNRPRNVPPDLGAFEFFVPPPPARDSVGVVDPQLQWYLRNSRSPGVPDFSVFAYGAPGWIPLTGDWDGNGTFTPAVFDPTTATFFLRNSNSAGFPDAGIIPYGAPGWTPVAGDWDGDGTTTIGVVDPTGTWYLRNSNTPGAPDLAPFAYGAPGWVPVVGDWDGNGTTTVGMFDPFGNWYLRNRNSPGAPDVPVFAYGVGSWKPVVGDWNNDGTTTVGVFDPSATWYLRNSNGPGAPDLGPFAYGAGGWAPLAGDWDNASALRAADGVGRGGAALSQGELEAAYSAALVLLAARGAVPGAALNIAALGGDLLGLASPAANAITLDDDAAGHGWFADPTPFTDEEFDSAGQALPGGPADGRVDLLTAVLHELGHLAGLDDNDGSSLMAGALGLGTRRDQALGAASAGK
jgi:hypothetical protein